MRWVLFAVLLLFPWLSRAATIHIALTGNDTTGDGSSGNPYRTIAKGESVAVTGDTVNIWGGDFDEYVQVSGVLGVKFQSLSNAVFRAWRTDTASNTLSGVTLSKACDADWRTWNAFLRIASDAHFTTVTNVKIIDQPWISVTNWSFNPSSPTNTISSPSVDFISKGFVTGGVFWVNGVSYSNTTRGAQFRFANQQRAVRPTNVTTTTLTFSNAVLTAETNPSVWAVISAGSTFDFHGILFDASGGGGPSNCLVTSCLFSNMVGRPIVVNGHDNAISNNTFTACEGNFAIVYGGYNIFIRSNLFYNCGLPAYYDPLTDWETVDHTGGNFYDYYVNFIAGSSQQTINTNVWIEGNWFEDIKNNGISIQHTVPGDDTDFHHTYIIGNVFVGIGGPLQGGQNYTFVQSNTFYRCAYQNAQTAAVGLGGEIGIYTNNTLYFTHNLIVSCGDHADHTDEGYPSFTVTTNITSHSNYVCGPEVSRWNAMPAWGATNGINGGDPMFVNEFSPRGPDGLPFTADDGLRLHPASPAAGIGALSVSNGFFAFFRPVNIASNFLDWTGTNFNLPWHSNLFTFTRTGWDREWDYGDAIANLPQVAVFTASNSISYTYSTNTWYDPGWFVWDFGDGSRPVITRWPDVTHTFLTTGQVTITLTWTNSLGAVSSHLRNYRILPGTNFSGDVYYVSTNGNNANPGTYASPLLGISNAMALATAGDYICVLPGDYYYFIDQNLFTVISNGTPTAPITIVGYNAVTRGLSQRKSWWIWEGFDYVVTNAPPVGFGAINVFLGATNNYFRNLYFHDSIDDVNFIYFGSITDTNYIMDVGFTNCFVYQTDNKVFFITGGSNVIIDACSVIRISGEGDFISAPNAYNYKLSRNYARDLGYTNASHADFVEGAFGAGPNRDWIIERNWVEATDTNSLFQVTSMGTNYVHDGTFTNVVFRNNVVIGAPNSLAPIGLDGPKIYNNLFWRSTWQSSHNIVHGGQGGGLRGIDIRNNIFYGCGQNGTNTGFGWYLNGTPYVGDPGVGTNSTFAFADYNYVAGSNNVAKQIGVDDPFHWAVTGQEVHGINGGDPKFAGLANYDFRLLSTSPLINAGVVLSGFTTDFWGRERGSAWDIGPFESESEAAVAGETNTPTSIIRGGTLRGGRLGR